MFPSASRHEVLKAVFHLASLIYGDEAEAGLMQMVLETEPREASLWWERGKFIPAMQEHLVMCPLVKFAVSLPSFYSPRKQVLPPDTEARRAEALFMLWLSGQRCWEPRTVRLGLGRLGPASTFPEWGKPSLPWGCFSLPPVWGVQGFIHPCRAGAWQLRNLLPLHWALSSGTLYHPQVVQQPS